MVKMKQNSESSATITPYELWRRMGPDEKLEIIDVREPDEYEGWHIESSMNMPVSTLSGVPIQSIVPKDKEIVTVCAHGVRSEFARRLFSSYGYRVRTMEGGMVAWNAVYDIAAVPCSVRGVKVLQVRRVGKGCMSYIIISGERAAVIDPTIDMETYLEAAEGNKIVAVLDTHAHADHVSGGKELALAETAPYYAPDEVGNIQHETVREGSEITAGEALIRVVSTPGHTPHSVTYLLGNLAFTGDTLFVESVGRPDLGQDAIKHAPVLWESVHNKILSLSAETTILPAHYGSGVRLEKGVPVAKTVGQLKSELKPLKMPRKDFVSWIEANTMPKPGNFETIKRINTGEMEIPDIEEIRELEAGPNRCAVSV